jgi:hypothetical protein
MGIDRFSNFILKSVNNDIIDEVNVENNIKLVASNCIIFDANFLIYQEIFEIEDEVNDIIKIILCLPFVNNNYSLLEDYLKKILLKPHWKIFDFKNLFDGFNEDEIITKFITNITNKIQVSNNSDELISIIELVIYEKILNKIIYLINKLHYTNFIQCIAIFFDGIPSFSKIIEQRRRRIKTYLESQERRKLYKLYFDGLEINNKKLNENLSKKYDCDDINVELYFDYIKWIKNRFTTNKSISPSSIFINNLEEFLNLRLSKMFPKSKIYINSSRENGESDLKIFKFIALNENNYDYSIHTSDSDLIHQIIVQQTYYKIINKDINFCLIKYIKKNNSIECAQIIDATMIIKTLLNSYSAINNIKTNNYKIIWDLCLLFYFFGNDHLPSSTDFGPELGLDFLYTTHYKALNNNNIINLKKSFINIDLNNLKILLQKINETRDQNITRIILHRFFKINGQLVNLLVDRFKLNFDGIKEFLKKFIINRGLKLSTNEFNDLDDSDMRKKFCLNIENPEEYNDFSIFNLNNPDKNLLIESINLIENNIDYYEYNFNGLILYYKQINITNDVYQDLYNFMNDKTNTNLNKLYPSYYEYNDINQHLEEKKSYNVNDYLKKIYHLVFSQFGNMKDFHNDNLTYYEYYDFPSISLIIDFINQVKPEINQTKLWLKEIKNENVNSYLDSSSHYLLISPFILSYNITNEIYKKIEPIDNLFVNDINDFNYRKININNFLRVWENALNNRVFKENLFNELIKINFL